MHWCRHLQQRQPLQMPTLLQRHPESLALMTAGVKSILEAAEAAAAGLPSVLAAIAEL